MHYSGFSIVMYGETKLDASLSEKSYLFNYLFNYLFTLLITKIVYLSV